MGRLYLCFIISFALAPASWSQVSVWTGQYNQARTSANLGETLLTTSNVNKNQFGLLFTRAVDDYVYAQPCISRR